MGKKIFVSYRRTDRHVAGLLRAEIEKRIGRDRVFMDSRDLDPGEGFPSRLLSEIETASVVFVIVGDGFSSEVGRLSDPDDWVRRELIASLGATRKIVPVILDDAQLPDPGELPAELATLLSHQAYRVDSSHLERDVDGLMNDLGLKRDRRGTVLAGVAAAVLVAVGAWIFWPSDDDDELSFLNTQLIFDTSSGMSNLMPTEDGTGNKTMAVAARERVSRYVEARDGDRLALRAAGSCGDGGTLLVPFQRSAAGDIEGSLNDQAYTGTSFPLSSAALAATNDFSDPEQFPPDLVKKQILVFTAGGDGCGGSMGEVQQRVAEIDEINLDWGFIGLGIEPGSEAAAQLQELANITGGRAFPVHTEEELESVLQVVLEIEPVADAATAIADIGNSIVAPLNDLISGTNGCRAEDARVAAVATSEAIDRSRPALRSLERRDDRASYVALHNAGVAWSGALAGAASRGDALIAQVDGIDGNEDSQCSVVRQSESWGEDVEAWNASVADADAALAAVTDARAVLNEEITQLLAE